MYSNISYDTILQLSVHASDTCQTRVAWPKHHKPKSVLMCDIFTFSHTKHQPSIRMRVVHKIMVNGRGYRMNIFRVKVRVKVQTFRNTSLTQYI